MDNVYQYLTIYNASSYISITYLKVAVEKFKKVPNLDMPLLISAYMLELKNFAWRLQKVQITQDSFHFPIKALLFLSQTVKVEKYPALSYCSVK